MFEETNHQAIDDTDNDSKRPTAITVICVIGFIGAAAAVPLLLSPYPKMVGRGYPQFLAASCFLGLVSMIGLWKMKQWGAYLYTGGAIISQIGLIGMGLWSPQYAVIPAIIVFIALKNMHKMS